MKKTYYNIIFHNPEVKNDVGGLCEKAFALENELTTPQLSAAKKLFKQGKNPFIWIIAITNNRYIFNEVVIIYHLL